MATRAESAGDGWLFPDSRPPARPEGEGARPRAKPRAKASTAGQPEPETADDLSGRLVEVAVARPVKTLFTYRVPEDLPVRAGARVVVPFARRTEVGVVVATEGVECELPPSRIKEVRELLDPEPLLDDQLLELTRWMAETYACSWGEALAALLPAPLKRTRGARKVMALEAVPGVGDPELEELLEKQPKQHRLLRTLIDAGAPLERADLLRRLNLSDSPARTLVRRGLIRLVEVEARPVLAPQGAEGPERVRPEVLSADQEAAVSGIAAPLERREHEAFLLYGVTGSGKTEVYLRVIERALELGRSAIVLVPEIALTPQTVGWFRSRFGEVAVLHSRMTDAQRLAAWMRVQRGEARVVVGARSALFAPVPDLGVVVVDEEHEPSFKQGSVPRYHARDVAIERARLAGAVCILGSATPSLESWVGAREGRLTRLDLQRRIHGGDPPPVEVVDLRREPGGAAASPFSVRLKTLLTETLSRGEQAILFLNRRGFSPVLWCRACGETVRCSDCDLALTYHRRIGRVVCHSCCEEHAPPRECPSCTAPALRLLGVGSEKVEQVLAEFLPEARVARMDSDTMLRREDYEDTLAAFGRGELDILVGTQMIAKGLDFPRVTLVGVVSADSTLHLPDLRAAERTFQLLAQVSGRAGRGELPGRILVQTVTPEHPAIVHAAKHDYEAFTGVEEPLRRSLGYPPFGRLTRIVVEDEDEQRVGELCRRLASELRGGGLVDAELQLLGPSPAPIAKLRGRARHHLLLKQRGGGAERLRGAIDRIQQVASEQSRPRVVIDVDPVSMM